MIRKNSAFCFAGVITAFLGWPTAHRHCQAGQQTRISFPFKYDPPANPYILVMVKINTDFPLPFVFDTGTSPPLMLANWAADKLNIAKKGKKITIARPKINLTEVPIDSAQIGGPPYFNLPLRQAYLTDLSILDQMGGSTRIAGICGMPLLSSQPVQIDFAARSVTYFLDKRAPPRIPGYSVISMHESGGVYYVKASVGSGAPVDLMLDTGSPGTMLPKSALVGVDLTAKHNSMNGIADGSLHVCDDTVIDRLRIGDAQIPNVSIEPDASSGILGLDVLSRFRVMFDCSNKVLILEPRKDARANEGTDDHGWVGLHVVPKGKDYEIAYVWPDSPAARGGVMTGDKIITIDGKSVNSLPMGAVCQVGTGGAGSVVGITIARSGKEIETRMQRISRPDAARNAFLGVDMTKKPGAVFVVNSVRKGSAAELGGLLPGDEIVEIDGVKIAPLTPIAVADRIDRPSVEVKLQRQGLKEPLFIKLTASSARP